MAFTALCIRLMTDVLVILVCSPFIMKTSAAFPRVFPDRQQFFEYDTVSMSCENIDGSAGRRVMWAHSPAWRTASSLYRINAAETKHSGEYWCENEEGERGDAVNITVTAGSVILESPARPVAKGSDLILRCTSKKVYLPHIADFYKDGVHLGTEYTSAMTITDVSKSDEGLYSCSISAAGTSGTSPESRLSVRELELCPAEPHVASLQSCHVYLVLRTVFTVLLLALLLLLVGLLHCGKLKVV